MSWRHFTISAILKHIFGSSVCNLLQESNELYSLLLLKVLCLKINFVVDLRDCLFDGLKSGVLALLFGLDETAKIGCKNKLNFFSVWKYMNLPCQVFRKLKSYDGYLVTNH